MASSPSGNSKVVERFAFSGEEGYSEFWRRNKSPVEIFELAQLLSGLRKVASYVGTNVGQIVWSGMEEPNAIAIDPTPVLGRYPIPAHKTDRIVGLTIRKAYEKTEWSHRLHKLAMARAKLPVRYAYKFQLFFDTCEKIYLDCLSNHSVLGNYTEAERKQAIINAETQWTHPPTISELLHIWWDMAADRKGRKYKEIYKDASVRGSSHRTSLEKFYQEPITLLNSIVDRLIYETPKIFGVSERCNYRMELYFSVWPGLFEIIQHWATDSKDPYLQASKFAPDLKGLGDDLEMPPVPTWFPEQIEKIIVKRTYEFTTRVKEVVEKKDEVVRVKENNLVMPGRKCINKKLLHHLKHVIKSAAQKKTAFNRGLRTGKMDRRRLYRAFTTGTIFQMSKSEFQLLNDIILLVDATGSMAAPNKWEKSEEIYQTLFSAIQAYNPKARLFAYNEVKSACRITELYLKDRFYSILPHGKTASGEALIAVAQYFSGTNKKPFIIHLTDGASNWGVGVESAIRYCHRHGINLLTLGLGCDESSKGMLRKEYGNLVQFVESGENLPNMFRDLLNKSKWA
jgi:hypothetical protein